jgi:hypothetical protein
MLHYWNAQRPLMRSDLQQSRYGTELKTSFEDTEQKDLEVDDSPALSHWGARMKDTFVVLKIWHAFFDHGQSV